MSASPRRILIINPFGIGDVLFSTPVVGALKTWQPDTAIGYLCNARTREVVSRDPRIEHVFVYEKDEFRRAWRQSKRRCFRMAARLARDICRARFDTALDFSLAEEFGFTLMWLGIRRRVGLDYRGRGRFLTVRIPFAGFDDRPIPDYYLQTLQALGIPVAGACPRLWTNEEDERYAEAFLAANRLGGKTLVGMAPGGGAAFGGSKAHYKRWPEERFAECARLLTAGLGAHVVLLVGPGEEASAEAIVQRCPSGVTVAARTTVCQMASLMRRCRAVIANDGGPLHVAVAAGVPTVSLFGPTDPRVYGPYPADPHRHRVLIQPVLCSPCYRRFKLPECAQNVCLSWIQPGRVVEEAARLLACAEPTETMA